AYVAPVTTPTPAPIAPTAYVAPVVTGAYSPTTNLYSGATSASIAAAAGVLALFFC
ncbi:hypothetical protein HDU99_010515, partial [Rhizoclosmatium hyalinum]